MSKLQKKGSKSKDAGLKEDIKFEKIIQFSGWIFLIALILFLGAWFVLDSIMDIIELELGTSTFTIIIFLGINSALSFGLASRIKKDRDQKKKLYLDWLIGEFLFCMFAIFAVAVYQW